MTEGSKASGATSWLPAIVALTMVATCAFMVVRITLFLLGEGLWYERLISGALLFAESFFLVNCVGYFANVLRVFARRGEETASAHSLPELEEYPPIAIVVASYREPHS